MASSYRIRDMSANRDSWVFALALISAAAVLISIAAAETLLVLACIAWLVRRTRPIVWPSYTIPVIVFVSATILAVIMSPQPTVGAGVMVRKAMLFTMGLLAANAVTTPARARLAYSVLLAVACATSILAIGQFVRKYIHFLSTG